MLAVLSAEPRIRKGKRRVRSMMGRSPNHPHPTDNAEKSELREGCETDQIEMHDGIEFESECILNFGSRRLAAGREERKRRKIGGNVGAKGGVWAGKC